MFVGLLDPPFLSAYIQTRIAFGHYTTLNMLNKHNMQDKQEVDILNKLKSNGFLKFRQQ